MLVIDHDRVVICSIDSRLDSISWIVMYSIGRWFSSVRNWVVMRAITDGRFLNSFSRIRIQLIQ